MSETITYAVSPDSVRAARLALAVMVGLTIAASSTAFWYGRWRSWWLVALAATLIPAGTALAFRGWRLGMPPVAFLTDVAAPLASTVGAACAAIGVLVAVVARRLGRS